MIAAAVALLSILAAGAVFGYQLYLKGALSSKSAQLDAAQQSIDVDKVEGFIRLKNRLSSVKQLLDQHIELTNFLDVLEARTLQTVRFNSLTVTVATDRSALVEMAGTARSFNALAAQSSAFAAEKRIKRAIFSGITVNANGTVSFNLTATIDPRLITSGEALSGVRDAGGETLPGASNIVPAAAQPTGTSTAPATSTVRTATTTAPAL